jgi:hypothetical protein
MTLEKLKEYAEDVAGQWNGDDSGIGEENADAALEILEAIKTIEENLEYISGNNNHLETRIAGLRE